MEGEVVLAGHPGGLDDLNCGMAFATLERLMVREARESAASMRIISDFQDAKKEEWAAQVKAQLQDAADDFEKPQSASAKTVRDLSNLNALMAAQQTGNFTGL